MKRENMFPLAVCLILISGFLVVMGFLTFNTQAETGDENTNQLSAQPSKEGCEAEVSGNRGVILVHKNVLISL